MLSLYTDNLCAAESFLSRVDFHSAPARSKKLITPSYLIRKNECRGIYGWCEISRLAWAKYRNADDNKKTLNFWHKSNSFDASSKWVDLQNVIISIHPVLTDYQEFSTKVLLLLCMDYMKNTAAHYSAFFACKSINFSIQLNWCWIVGCRRTITIWGMRRWCRYMVTNTHNINSDHQNIIPNLIVVNIVCKQTFKDKLSREKWEEKSGDHLSTTTLPQYTFASLLCFSCFFQANNHWKIIQLEK